MGWKGMALGGCVGSLFGGPLGALLGAALGHQIEKQVKGEGVATRARPYRTYRLLSPQKRAMIFCASAAAMLAKMAKADGHISRDEIDSVEQAFMRLGFTSLARDYAVNVFRKAKDDAHTIYQYADEFAAAVDSVEVRELFYEILWDLACADGQVSASERAILERIPRALRIRADWFAFFAQQRLGAGAGTGGRRAPTPQDELRDAYAVLGAAPSDSLEDVQRKYRDLAKKNHPDALRAQGLPEELVGKATERMGRINAAWATIRSARGGRSGQVALYLVLVLVAITVLVLANVGTFLSVTAKNRAMNAGDAAALAVAKWQGELINKIGELNVEHLKTALDVDERNEPSVEAARVRCADVVLRQRKTCFLDPLDGIRLGNEAARANGAKPSDEMTETLKQHVIDVRTQYATTLDLYPEPWAGAWEEYARMLEEKLGQEMYAGPDNIEFVDDDSGHYLLNREFYHAIAGRNWCWFHYSGGGLLDSYSGFRDWSPLPRADDATRLNRCSNSEVYSLHLQARTGRAVDLLGVPLIQDLTGATQKQIEESTLLNDPEQTWFFYDTSSSGYWRSWWEIDPGGEWQFPVVGSVKTEYDVRGAAAICRVTLDAPSLVTSAERTAVWSAAAKPFGTVEDERGAASVVTARKELVLPGTFRAARLVPIDAVGGKDTATADAEWMRHVREDLPAYLLNGPSSSQGCYYCSQLVAWERPSLRQQGREWLRSHSEDCSRPSSGGYGRGGTPHGH